MLADNFIELADVGTDGIAFLVTGEFVWGNPHSHIPIRQRRYNNRFWLLIRFLHNRRTYSFGLLLYSL